MSLTRRGRAVLVAAAPRHVRSVRANLVDLLTPAEIRTLDRIAGKVIAHLSG